MVDVSKFTYDTPVLVKIMRPAGVYIPEMKTYIPLEAYTSIHNVISILNRNISVTFPNESNNHEISKTIEDMIIYYKQKEMEANEKTGYIGTDVENALDTIQEINDSRISREEQLKEIEEHIFDYSDITAKIVRNLSNNIFHQVFSSDEFRHGEDILKSAEKERKSRERLEKQKKVARSNHTEDAMALMMYTHNRDLDIIDYNEPGDLEYLPLCSEIPKGKRKKNI